MMENDMMDFFVLSAVVQAGVYEQSIVYGTDDDGFHNGWGGQDVRPAHSSSTPPGLGFSVMHGLKLLVEEEEIRLSLDKKDESNLNYPCNGNGGAIHKDDDQYLCDCDSLEYTSSRPTHVADTGM